MKRSQRQPEFPQHLCFEIIRLGQISVRRAGDSKISAGFTLIELMIATVIFAIVLTVMVTAFVQVGRIFYKGVSVSNTQNAARSVISNISSDLVSAKTYTCTNEGSGKDETCKDSSDVQYFCMGLHRYSFDLSNPKQKLTGADVISPNSANPIGVVQSVIPNGCPKPSIIPGANTKQLLGPDMQLNDFGVKCANSFCTINIHIVFYGSDPNVFTSKNYPNDPSRSVNEPDATCSGNLLSTQFCTATDMSTSINMRF